MQWPLVTKRRHRAELSAAIQRYLELETKYRQVQQGYDLGVLEGTRQAYVNVRAFLADNMENSPPKERAFLVTGRHPRLGALGQMESKLIAELRGYPEALRKELGAE